MYRFREVRATVLIAGRETGKTYTSKLGYPITSECTIESLQASALDAVIVPGGYAPDHLRAYPEVLKLVGEMDAAGKVVAAICHAGWVLCSSGNAHNGAAAAPPDKARFLGGCLGAARAPVRSVGILKGRRATSYFTIRDDMLNAGAIWEDAEVVVDGKLVTSRHPNHLPAFCWEIDRLLS